VETTWGFACVFDLTSRGPDYTQHDLEACDPGGRRDEVFLLWTGRSEPAFCPEAMLWLRDRAPRAVGIDAGGFAPGASHQARDAVLMDAGILVIENVTNLHSLPPRGAEVFFFPLDVPGADAAPVRMVARLPVPSPL
jgi:kynurenine formamidase